MKQNESIHVDKFTALLFCVMVLCYHFDAIYTTVCHLQTVQAPIPLAGDMSPARTG